MSEKTKVISQGDRFREIVTITEIDGKKVSITHHEQKRNGNWVKRTSRKAYNIVKESFKPKKNKKKGEISVSTISLLSVLSAFSILLIVLYNLGRVVS